MLFRVRIFTQNFVRYIRFDALENYILMTPRSCHFQATGKTFPEEMLAKLKHLFCGTSGLVFQLLAPDKLQSILEPRYGR